MNDGKSERRGLGWLQRDRKRNFLETAMTYAKYDVYTEEVFVTRYYFGLRNSYGLVIISYLPYCYSMPCQN